MRTRPVQAQLKHITISGIVQAGFVLDIASLQIVNSCYKLTLKSGSAVFDSCKNRKKYKKSPGKIPGKA